MYGSISAIVPTFNRSNFLGETISALQNQTREVLEIIIWDDGSTDDTPIVIAELVANDPGNRIRYFCAENRGKSAALNAALDEASGDYIWICDDDDIALPNAAEHLAGTLDHSDAGLVGGRHVRFSVNATSGEKEFSDTGYWPDLSSGSVIRHILEDIFFFQNGSLVRRSSFASVGPFRANLKRSIDYDMFVRLGTRFPIDMVDGVLFEQRKHDGVRGPAAQRHAADQSEAVWREADRAIFADLRDVIAIEFYAAFFEASLPEHAMRAGLLQRGCVYARRGDWKAAIEDFEAAALILPKEPLTLVEKNIVIRSMAAKHDNPETFKNPVSRNLVKLKHLNDIGKDISKALGRGALWRARTALMSADLAQFMRIATFCAQAGISSRQGQATLPLKERNRLNPEAYTW
jgi:glycosyltransferase involved in cell wall biosynthesis